MIIYSKVTEIFCLVDEFCKKYDQIVDKALLGNPSNRPSKMSKSEVITRCILFQLSGFRTFEHFYIFYVQKHMKDDFPFDFAPLKVFPSIATTSLSLSVENEFTHFIKQLSKHWLSIAANTRLKVSSFGMPLGNSKNLFRNFYFEVAKVSISFQVFAPQITPGTEIRRMSFSL